ncbi:MAG: BatD family protein [Planctomycetes bacterium]|nr:BatD family protein [Planctomycetota bacterium]MBL7146105.1 BatD family protein [Phycisphaerae bacterium]
MKNVKFIIAIVTLLSMFSASASAQVQVVAQVDKSEDIYVGQSFRYLIIIDGDNKAGQVDLSPLAQYNPQSTGNQDISQTSTTIINNKVSRKDIKRYVMSYSLTVNRPGQIQLPPVTIALDGSQYQTNPVQLNILKPGITDKLDFDVVLSEQKCYVGQPVIMTVKFYVSASADVGEFQFNLPALTSDSFYIEEPEISDPQAKLYRLNSTTTAHVSQRAVEHKGESFILVSFNKVLIPRQAGRIDIGTSSVSAALAVGQVRSRDPFLDNFSFFGSQKKYQRFAVNSQPLNLLVLPLPEQGKPEGFYGLVGRYTIEASATPTKVSVGDPITLTIKIGGSRYLKPVQWPRLDEVAVLERNFKFPSQKASPTIQDNMKVFTQTIRANNDKITQIPSIPLAFFDVDKGIYVESQTAPIELEVAPTKILTNADLEGIDPTYVNRQIEAIKKGISANYEGPDVLTNQTFSPLVVMVSPGYMVFWSVPLVVLVTSSLVKLITHTSPEKLAYKRRRQAAGKAVKQLKKISGLNPKERQELLVSTMKQYIGERFDKVAGSLTADDCYQKVASVMHDTQTAEKYRDTLAKCEASRYASAEASEDSGQVTEVIKLIKTIEKNSKE